MSALVGQTLHLVSRVSSPIRTILVEAVWRFLRWQPGWHAAKKMQARLKESAAIRKKTVVALARQLAIDLWRWRTGRVRLADLGWLPA